MRNVLDHSPVTGRHSCGCRYGAFRIANQQLGGFVTLCRRQLSGETVSPEGVTLTNRPLDTLRTHFVMKGHRRTRCLDWALRHLS